MTYNDIKEGAKMVLENHEGNVDIQDVMELTMATIWVSTKGKRKTFDKLEKQIRAKYPEVAKIMDIMY